MAATRRGEVRRDLPPPCPAVLFSIYRERRETMDRTICVTVNGEFVKKDSKNAGVQGEANVTSLHITMSGDWEQFSKRIIWRDAFGENPVSVLLYNTVSDLVSEKDPLTFDTPIPAEPLALPGWCSFTIEGFKDGDPSAVSITVTDHLLVKVNDTYHTPKEPTPTQAQQLQTQIDQIVPQVTELVGNAVDALEQAEQAVKVWEAWDGAKTYLPLQKVSRLGSSYICKTSCAGIDPAVDTADGGGVEGMYWLMIASKGDQGDQGAAGEKGNTGKQGIQGPQGIQGIPGPQGIQGPAGPRGIDAVAVETAGMVNFSVDVEGRLLCTYTGAEAPNYYINDAGHLCLDIGGEV